MVKCLNKIVLTIPTAIASIPAPRIGNPSISYMVCVEIESDESLPNKRLRIILSRSGRLIWRMNAMLLIVSNETMYLKGHFTV